MLLLRRDMYDAFFTDTNVLPRPPAQQNKKRPTILVPTLLVQLRRSCVEVTMAYRYSLVKISRMGILSQKSQLEKELLGSHKSQTKTEAQCTFQFQKYTHFFVCKHKSHRQKMVRYLGMLCRKNVQIPFSSGTSSWERVAGVNTGRFNAVLK